jgi:hypothetical protein
MNKEIKELLEESLDLIQDLFELVDSANLTDEELELLNNTDGLADREVITTSKIVKYLQKYKEEK